MYTTTPSKRIFTVKQTAKTYPEAFSEASLRWLIFNEKTNGFNCCIRRIGRKVLIDLDQFEQWIDQQAQSDNCTKGNSGNTSSKAVGGI